MARGRTPVVNIKLMSKLFPLHSVNIMLCKALAVAQKRNNV